MVYKYSNTGWIDFGLTKNFGQKAETRIGGQSVANVKHHKIRLDKLQPGITYYYRACSVNKFKK